MLVISGWWVGLRDWLPGSHALVCGFSLLGVWGRSPQLKWLCRRHSFFVNLERKGFSTVPVGQPIG